jgi:hypothetical protein
VITDFNQSSGSYNSSEGDKIDLSAILGSIFGQAGTHVAEDYVRIGMIGGLATLQVDVSGGGANHDNHNWQNVATLTGVTVGATIDVVLDQAQQHHAFTVATA